jgi:Mn-dependent DtxR family transcriptional regulator
MALHESAEMYLETIYTLAKERGNVRSIDVAEHMGYSKPSVSRAVGLLKNSGHLIMERDGSLILTSEGEQVARNIYERHTILTAMLTRLGVDPATAAEDACRIEHVISEESFRAIREHIKL